MNMKKVSLGLLLFITLLITSCGGKKAENTTVVEEQQIEVEATLPEGSAQMSLDYLGTYSGVLPTASGEGMNVTVVLDSDSSYTKTISYIGKKDAPITIKGKYVWSADGNTITLESVEKPNQYFVSEGKIIQLDTEGKRITGDLANMQILTKENEKVE